MKFDRRIIYALALGISTAPAETPSFSREILPTLQSHCAICHSTGAEAGHLGLAPSHAYTDLIKGLSTDTQLRLVKPGEPDRSYLIMKLEGTHLDHGGKGVRMPFGDIPLDKDFIGLIRQWIASGAPDN